MLLGARAAAGQPAGTGPWLGWLTSSSAHMRNVDSFRERMTELGYRELRLELRAAEGHPERLPALMADYWRSRSTSS